MTRIDLMMRMMGVRLLCSAVLAAGFGLGLIHVAPASAQALSLDEVKSCLCLEDTIQRLGQEIDSRTQARDRQQAQVQRMDRDLAQRYALVNVDEELQVEQYKYLYEQRQRQQAVLNDYSTALVSASNRYNRAVVTFNAQCTTRPMIKSLVEKAKQNLMCPAAP